MQASSFFGLSFLLFLSVKPLLHLRPSAVKPSEVWSEQALSGEQVYYFIEAQCTSYSPAAGGETGKYLIVTPGISTADYDTHQELLEKFRLSLTTRFPNAPALRDGLTFIFHFTKEEAETMREAELEQKKDAGYEILELELTQ